MRKKVSIIVLVCTITLLFSGLVIAKSLDNNEEVLPVGINKRLEKIEDEKIKEMVEECVNLGNQNGEEGVKNMYDMHNSMKDPGAINKMITFMQKFGYDNMIEVHEKMHPKYHDNLDGCH
ncbi:hypothetical protein [Thermohalobacter berrensis]|uniref:Uncharacterized protein n=1 Tax=Thermohalobacter berrensis TaxID=99594 RepID=A0A419T182_9FIRM|nr:hypothetical protein [Thermohalobacter berrensis]RKD31227.1 hypothetical protein BET03_03615 [Thermohalobacter berrensis]